MFLFIPDLSSIVSWRDLRKSLLKTLLSVQIPRILVKVLVNLSSDVLRKEKYNNEDSPSAFLISFQSRS